MIEFENHLYLTNLSMELHGCFDLEVMGYQQEFEEMEIVDETHHYSSDGFVILLFSDLFEELEGLFFVEGIVLEVQKRIGMENYLLYLTQMKE